MQIYKVPFNFNHEEKIFGGYLSIRQALYLVLGALMLAIFFIPKITVFIKSMMFLILATVFILFAFLKIDEVNSDKYFIYTLKFVLRNKKYIKQKGKE